MAAAVACRGRGGERRRAVADHSIKEPVSAFVNWCSSFQPEREQVCRYDAKKHCAHPEMIDDPRKPWRCS
jgi:hypothetical protein